MFTRQQIEEIAKKLEAMGLKDSQFKKVDIIDGSEEMLVLQNGENKRMLNSQYSQFLSEVVAELVKENLKIAVKEALVDTVREELETVLDADFTEMIDSKLDAFVLELDGNIETRINVISNFLESLQTQIVDILNSVIGNIGTIEENISSILETIISSINSLSNTIVEGFDEQKTYRDGDVILTVKTNVETAIVELDGTITDSITVKRNSNVVVRIIDYNGVYESYNQIICVHRTEELNINLTLKSTSSVETLLFTINATPENATVYINNVVQNSINCYYGDSVYWRVEADGYISQSGISVITESTTLNITLVKEITFTVTVEPDDAIVKLNDVETRSITVGDGEEIRIEATCEGYEDFSTTETASETNQSYNIVMTKKQVTLTVEPTPSDATVLIDSIERGSITVEYGTEVVIEVSHYEYDSYSTTLVVTSDITLPVSLSPKSIVAAALSLLDITEDGNKDEVSGNGGTFKLKAGLTTYYSNSTTEQTDVTEEVTWSTDNPYLSHQGSGVFIWETNPTSSIRTATISASINVGSNTYTAYITSTQFAGNSASFGYLLLDTDTLDFGQTTEQLSVVVLSSSAWRVTGYSVLEFALSQNSGEAGQTTVTVTCSISASEAGSRTLTLTNDDGKEATLTLTFSARNYIAASSEMINLSGGSATITITSSSDWTVSGSSDMVNCNRINGNAGTTEVTFSVQVLQESTTTFTFTNSEGASVSVVVNVTV